VQSFIGGILYKHSLYSMIILIMLLQEVIYVVYETLKSSLMLMESPGRGFVVCHLSTSRGLMHGSLVLRPLHTHKHNHNTVCVVNNLYYCNTQNKSVTQLLFNIGVFRSIEEENTIQILSRTLSLPRYKGLIETQAYPWLWKFELWSVSSYNR
jgi:hypothetical protein